MTAPHTQPLTVVSCLALIMEMLWSLVPHSSPSLATAVSQGLDSWAWLWGRVRLMGSGQGLPPSVKVSAIDRPRLHLVYKFMHTCTVRIRCKTIVIDLIVFFILSVAQCPGLDAPANGNIETTGMDFWDTATYSCSRGFILVGVDTRTCQANGAWSGNPSFCTCKCWDTLYVLLYVYCSIMTRNISLCSCSMPSARVS